MLTKKEIEQRIDRLDAKQSWWHDIELPFGLKTRNLSEAELLPNHNVPKWNKIKPFVQVEGKRVIDIGCNEGFFCLQMINCGANYVLGIDVNPLRIEKATFVLQTLNISGVDLLQESIYNLASSRLGKFDLALCLGILQRVPDPFTALQVICGLADTAVFEWYAFDSDEPIMKFRTFGHKDYDHDNSGYWIISRRCLKDMLWRNGFTHCFEIETNLDRQILIATRLEPLDPLCQRLDPHDGLISPGQVAREEGAINKGRGVKTFLQRLVKTK